MSVRINPVPGYKVGSRYGKRTPIKIDGGETLPWHYGDDYPAPIGTPIVSVLPGRVVRVGVDNDPDYEEQGIERWPGLRDGWLYGGGWWIFIQTGSLTVRYMHLNRKPTLAVGDTVSMGERIGEVGATGVVTGPHLHLETLVDGLWVDPQSIIPSEYLHTTHTTEGYEIMATPIYVTDSIKKNPFYVLNPFTGKRRLIPRAEWNAIRKAEKLGKGIEVALVEISTEDLNKIPLA